MSLPPDIQNIQNIQTPLPAHPPSETDTALKSFFGLIGMNENEGSSWSPSQSISIPINIQTKDGPITYIITTTPDEDSKLPHQSSHAVVDQRTGHAEKDAMHQVNEMDEMNELHSDSQSESSRNQPLLSTISSTDLKSSGLRVPVSDAIPVEETPEVRGWRKPVNTKEEGVLPEPEHRDFEETESVDVQSRPGAESVSGGKGDTITEVRNGKTLAKPRAKKLKSQKKEPNPIPRRKIIKKNRRPKNCQKNGSSRLESTVEIEENSEGSEGGEIIITQKSTHKKKRKIADWLAEGIDPTKLEENVDQVRNRFEKGCECPGENCFEGLSPEFVYKHRLNVAELTRAEHDMYLMGVTMATLSNPEATAKHTKRQRLRTSYVFLGREVCLDAWLYLENCTHYQLKRIRKHLITHGVSPRVHGNQGKKPHNTFPFRSYQLAFDFLNNWFAEFVRKLNKSNAAAGIETSKSKSKHTPAPIYLPQELTRKKLHQEYKTYFQNQARSHPDRSGEEEDPDEYKVMGYSSFSQFLKVRFPHVKFAKVELNNSKAHQQGHIKEVSSCNNVIGSSNQKRDDTALDSVCSSIQSIEKQDVNNSSSNVTDGDHFLISTPISSDDKGDNVETCTANLIYLETCNSNNMFDSNASSA